MESRPLGRTGLDVSALGFGAGPLGDGALTEDASDAIVNSNAGMRPHMLR